MAEPWPGKPNEVRDRNPFIDPAQVGVGDVLVLRALGLGDALTGIPALLALRRHVQPRRVVLAVSTRLGSWLASLGVIDAICPTDELAPLPAMQGGHLAIDLHGNGPRSADVLEQTGPCSLIAFGRPLPRRPGPAWCQREHEVMRWCRLVAVIGANPDVADLRLRSRPQPDPLSRQTGSSRRPRVVIHPGAAFGSRRWGASRWAAVGRRLADDGAQITITGGPNERALCAAVAAELGNDAVDLCGSLDLSALTRVVAGTDLLLSADTGVAHLATALATPSVTLFGPTPPTEWGPLLDHDLHAVLWPGRGADRGDPNGTHIDPRLDAIPIPIVLTTARRQLARTRGLRHAELDPFRIPEGVDS